MTGTVTPAELPPAPDPVAAIAARRERLARCRLLLAEHGLAVGLISRPALIRHLCGVRLDAGLLSLSSDDAWLALPEAAAGVGSLEGLGVEAIAVRGYDPGELVDPAAALATLAAAELTRRRPRGPIGAELAYLPALVASALAGETRDVGPLLDADRRPKDGLELAGLRRAVAMVERALAAALEAAIPGATERDLLDAVAASLARDAGEDVQLAANIATGERTAIDDPHATARVLRPGDLVLLDLYPVVEGHAADLTRTWIIGEAAPELRARHAALADALAAGSAALAIDAPAADVHRRVHQALAVRAGPLAASMRHHSGHGIGVFAWERPWIGERSTDPIGSSSVVCIEPGLYEPAVGGLRLEGELLVDASGVERLDGFPDGLLELPA